MLYKHSKYNLVKKYGKELLIYNLVSNNVAVLDEAYLNVFEHLDGDKNIIDELYKSGFIVEAQKDEIAFVNSRRHSVTYGLFHEKFFVVLPTTDCNARCKYCYQGNWQPIVMSDRIADATVDFIEKSVSEKDNVTVCWFGGEPLMNIPAIRKMSRRFVGLFGPRYKSMMTTNASFITEALASEMKKEWKTESVQITIDNLYDRYDAVKGYIDQTKFVDIIDAVESCLNVGIQVKIRINTDKYNYKDLDSICAYLFEKFESNKLFSMYTALLTADSADCYNCGFYDENEYKDVIPELLELRYRYTKNPTVADFTYPEIYTTCSAKTNYAFVVSPDGKLYKCQHITENDCVGNVFDGVIFNEAMGYYLSPNVSPKCEKCLFFPACHGGCPYSVRHGLHTGSMCREIKYDWKKRLDIMYRIFKNDKEVRQ